MNCLYYRPTSRWPIQNSYDIAKSLRHSDSLICVHAKKPRSDQRSIYPSYCKPSFANRNGCCAVKNSRRHAPGRLRVQWPPTNTQLPKVSRENTSSSVGQTPLVQPSDDNSLFEQRNLSENETSPKDRKIEESISAKNEVTSNVKFKIAMFNKKSYECELMGAVQQKWQQQEKKKISGGTMNSTGSSYDFSKSMRISGCSNSLFCVNPKKSIAYTLNLLNDSFVAIDLVENKIIAEIECEPLCLKKKRGWHCILCAENDMHTLILAPVREEHSYQYFLVIYELKMEEKIAVVIEEHDTGVYIPGDEEILIASDASLIEEENGDIYCIISWWIKQDRLEKLVTKVPITFPV